jgi:hypothetical protein
VFHMISKQESDAELRRPWARRYNHVAAGLLLTSIAIALLAVGPAKGQTVGKESFTFVNAVDNTHGFSSFGSMPAINNAGAVAFQAAGAGFEFGSISRWQDGSVTTIATSDHTTLTNFGENPIIKSSGTVGFSVRIPGDAILATGNGGR